ncbi:hypothetical protein SUGI_0974560 [Cryptomeria japonica]|nr:hypothetical protein SUGI_0974560 [Cryptomeria japonica]
MEVDESGQTFRGQVEVMQGWLDFWRPSGSVARQRKGRARRRANNRPSIPSTVRSFLRRRQRHAVRKGATTPAKTITYLDDEDPMKVFVETISVNLNGSYYMSECVLPYMPPGLSSIINISST